MAIIPLRQYNREIEGLIDTGQLDEAAAHCRHILETFPKHIATYRLLGKAYLEQQRYGDAVDIFQRVLSSVPDDYVSNIGLSIIREDEGNLDAAIWYMERASEAQPSNTAIRDELRRLYGRRDGIEPPKIRLTRAALARMYARGGLFDQAIAELRAALSEDPQRPDLQVLLAQMYFQMGQQVEAVDACGNLLKRLPYCLVANRILAAILPRTERAEDTKTYHHRAIALDPYFSSAQVEALTADAVPEATINIEKLTYKPGQSSEGSAQPAWAASLGIAFEDKKSETLPEWLNDQNVPEATKAGEAEFTPSAAPFSWEMPEAESTPAESPLSPDDAIPDWMKEAGWQPATSAASEATQQAEYETSPEESEGEIAKAELPDWLKGIAPSGVFDEQTTDKESDQDESDLPWLQKTTPGASDTIVNWLGAKKPVLPDQGEIEETPPVDIRALEEQIPDWLRDLNPPAPIPTEASGLDISDTQPVEAKLPPTPSETVTTPEQMENEALPDWLEGVESSYDKSGITDWLKKARIDENGEIDQPAEDLPDWLKEMADLTPSATGQAMVEPVAEFTATPDEDLPDWLKEMGAPQIDTKEFASAETTAEEPAVPAEELPDWLRAMGEQAAEITAPTSIEPDAEELALPAEELPDWLKEMDAPQIDTKDLTASEPGAEGGAMPAEEQPEWFREMGEPPTELTTVEPVAEEITTPDEELPDWIMGMDALQIDTKELTQAELVAEEPALPAEEPPDWLKEIGAPAADLVEIAPAEPVAEEPALTAEEVPDWLKEMGAPAAELTETATAEPATEEPALPAEKLPDWLKEFGAPAAELAEIAPDEPVTEEPALPAEELPDWLKEMGAPAAELTEIAPAEPVTEEPALPAEELPDWLKEMGAPAAELTETAPAEPVTEEPALPAEELPDWLKEFGAPAAEFAEITPDEPVTEEQALPAEEHDVLDIELPDWLIELGKPEAETAQLTPPEPAPSESIEEAPDWPKTIQETIPADERAPAEISSEATPFEMELADQDAALAWLESLAAQHGVSDEELITKPEDRLDVMPAWIKEESEATAPEAELTLPEVVESEPIPPVEEVPDWLKDTGELIPPADIKEPATIPAEEAAPVIDWNDQDAALAWLEKLAAQQGAAEEELITKPEDRLDSMPDWVRVDAETAQPDELVPVQEKVDEEVIPTSEALLDWLQEGAEAETAPVEPAPTEPIEALPEWLQERTEAETAPVEPAPTEPIEALPDWLQEMAISDTAPVEPASTEPIEALPDWLVETSAPSETGEPVAEPLEGEGLPDWLKETSLPTPEQAGIKFTGDVEELPDWLKEVEQPSTGEPESFAATSAVAPPSWMPEAIMPESSQPAQPEPIVEIPQIPVEVERAELLPEPEPIDINTASLSQLEHLPGIGFVAAQNIVAYREANGPFQSIGDLEQVNGMDQYLIESLGDRLTVAVPALELEPIPFIETEETIFAAARHAMEQGQVNQAVEQYQRLIDQRAGMDQVIVDMQSALYRYPLDINLWVILGDAYVRTDKLQEALDAYTEAEELLR
jgi:competence ComEA-like helix-hairpin-helix protein